jgi:large subunit ribosomal protein L22
MATTERTEVRAEARWVRVSARKARVVTEHIRGRSVPEARTVLAFTQRAAAREIEKVLRSAVANAESNHGLVGDELVVSAAYVDEGPTLKRWRARARGRAARIRKRTCHITVRLAEPIDGSRATSAAAVAGTAEAPRRRQRRRAPVETPAPEAATETTAVEPDVEETPVEPDVEQTSVEDAVVVEETPVAEEPSPEAEAPVAEEQPAAEEKPKRRTRSKKTDEEQE